MSPHSTTTTSPSVGARLRGSKAGIAGLLGTLALAAAAPLAADEQPGPRTVAEVSIEGNEVLGDSEIRDYMLTQRPSWRHWVERPRFEQAAFDEDLLRIRSLYRLRGHYEARVSGRAEPGPGAEEVSVEVEVVEGPAVVLEALEVERPAGLDVDAATWQTWIEALPLQPGEVFRLDHYAQAKNDLLTRLADRSHPRAELLGSADVDLARHTARVAWRVSLGPRVLFGPVAIGGLEDVEDEIVRRELAIEPGAPYTAVAIAKTRRALQRLQLFQRASIEVRSVAAEQEETEQEEAEQEDAAEQGDEAAEQEEREGEPRQDGQGERRELDGEAETWPVRIELAERPTRSLELSVGGGTEDKFRARAIWEHRNFLGGARRLELDARYSSLLSAGEVRLVQPRFPDSKTTLGLRTSIRYETPPAYRALRALGSFDFERPLWTNVLGRLGYELSYNDFASRSDVADLVIREPEGQSLVNKFRTGLTRSTIDNILDGRDGTWLDATFEPAVSATGPSFAYLAFGLDLRGYHPVGPFVVAGRFEIATIQPIAGSDSSDIQPNDRLYAGGSNSVRGYGFQKLGPKDRKGNPVGGTSRIVGSAELRSPLWRKLGAVVFVDMGQVYLEPFTFDLDELRFTSGGGLRYDTPVGPVRLDVGVRLNPESNRGGYHVHFSIGQAF